MVHLRLSPWMYLGVNTLSEKLGMTVSDVIRMGINEIIKKESPLPREKSSVPSEESPLEPEVEEEKQKQIEEYIRSMLTDAKVQEWINQVMTTLQHEIHIIEQKIEKMRQIGETDTVIHLEKELQKLKKQLMEKQKKYRHQKISVPSPYHSTGTLHLSKKRSKKSKKKQR